MTIEIRQMVIKSNIASDAGAPVSGQPAGDDACGSSDGGRGDTDVRNALVAELERLQER